MVFSYKFIMTNADSAPRFRDSLLHILQHPRSNTPGGSYFFGSFPFLTLRLPCHVQCHTLETCASIIISLLAYARTVFSVFLSYHLFTDMPIPNLKLFRKLLTILHHLHKRFDIFYGIHIRLHYIQCSSRHGVTILAITGTFCCH